MPPMVVLLFLVQIAAAQWENPCCQFSTFRALNQGSDRVSDGRRAQFLCTLDAADVPNFDFGFLEQIPGSGNFSLSIYLRAPVRSSQVEELWTANREHLIGINSTFEFEAGRGMSLIDQHGQLVWSANSTTADSFAFDCSVGNLALLDSRNSSVWQSFDFPTDTVVQGQTLTYQSTLVSRRSASDPSPGFYSMTVEASGLVLRDDRSQQPYWIFSVMGQNVSSDVARINCENFQRNPSSLVMISTGSMTISSCGRSLDVRFQSWPTPDTNRTARLMKLDHQGRLQVFNWNLGSKVLDFDFLGNDCALPFSCGSFGVCQALPMSGTQCSCLETFSPRKKTDATQGCVLPAEEEEDLSCSENAEAEVFEMIKHTGLTTPTSQYSNSTNQTASSAEDCSSSCLGICSCRVAVYRQASRQCFTHGDVNFQSFQRTADPGNVAFVKLERTRTGWSKNKAVIIGVSLSCVFVIGVAVLGLFLRCRHRKGKNEESDDEEDEEAFLESLPGLPPRFSMKALDEASDGFSHKLGQGGFGEVYLGRLSNGLQVAIKKLASVHQGKKEFRAEVATIGNIHHVNLVRLRGFCATASNRLLVYDYMSNGSLASWLFGSNKGKLEWKSRFEIALGTARGLAYLHESCKERILHLDVKPQNILLDESFVPKVADFGLAKLLGGGETHVFTTMRGTPGYLAPEWLTSAINDKSDVYSYGIVLLELVSGRHNYRSSENEPLLSLWASEKLEEGRSLEVVEESLRESLSVAEMKQAETVVNAAVWCVQLDPSNRPSMSTVVRVLEGLVEAEKPPALQQVGDSEHYPSRLMEFITSSSSSATSVTPFSISTR